jgi:ABC-type antimicrobial peptide transport system permease subunit
MSHDRAEVDALLPLPAATFHILLALGAQSGAIVGMVVREGVALAAVGIVAGAGLGCLAGRAMQAPLVGVRPGDPLTMIAATGVCFATVVLGCLRPAARAARVDPMAALRT